ncbi:MAG: hypothetical protein AAFS10_07865, partial [Myxococcota bacterium]
MSTAAYTHNYHATHQELSIAGELRPQSVEMMSTLLASVEQAAQNAQGTLYIDLKKLRYLNHRGFAALIQTLKSLGDRHPELTIKIITTSVVPGSRARFVEATDDLAHVEVEQYDDAFYQSQGFVENADRIPILRSQTRI